VQTIRTIIEGHNFHSTGIPQLRQFRHLPCKFSFGDWLPSVLLGSDSVESEKVPATWLYPCAKYPGAPCWFPCRRPQPEASRESSRPFLRTNRVPIPSADSFQTKDRRVTAPYSTRTHGNSRIGARSMRDSS
jgi:hypothetical protein